MKKVLFTGIIILILAAVGYIAFYLPVVALMEPTSTVAAPRPTGTPLPVVPTSKPISVPVSTPSITYLVNVPVLHVRNVDGDHVGYLHKGDTVECLLAKSGWCVLENSHRIWGGCLDPNTNDLGCKAK